jgi:hypothetical protein
MSTGDAWVSVSWMPHTSLSQTSYVCLAVRSAHVSWTSSDKNKGDEWKVQVTIHGIAGLILAETTSQTSIAPVRARARRTPLRTQPNDAPSSPLITKKRDNEDLQQPSITKATHDCVWDYVIHLPLRWQDLPRDAYLDFQVVDTAHDDRTLFQAILPLFTAHGRLQTGLQRAELYPSPSSPFSKNASQNSGLYAPQRREESPSVWVQGDEDPVWKASCILHQLQVLGTSKTPTTSLTTATATTTTLRSANPNIAAFGSVPSIPWLDSITKENCQQVIQEEKQEAEVRMTAYFTAMFRPSASLTLA